MRFKKLFIFLYVLLCSILFIGGFNVVAEEAGTARYDESSTLASASIGYGINYKSVSGLSRATTTGTLVNQVVNMVTVPSLEGLVITSWSYFQSGSWKMAHVDAIATNYEATHPGYTVLAAVNGDFYDISGTGNFKYQPTGALVSDGNYYKSSPSKSSVYNVLSFNNDGSKTPVSYATGVTKSSTPILAIYDANDNIIKEFNIDKVNETPLDNEIAVYYGIYNSDQAYVAQATDVISGKTYVVGKAKYSLPNKALDYYGIGAISSVLEANANSQTLTSGQFAISSNNSEVSNALSQGVTIRVQYEWTDALSNAENALNAGTQVLVNGQAPSDVNTNDGSRMNARHPRTALGIKSNGDVVLAVVDGRQESDGRYGVYGNELAAVMKTYGCVDAFNLDGGGSSIMYYRQNGKLVLGNKYSDASERSVSNVIIVAVKDPEVQVGLIESTSNSLSVSVNLLDKSGHNFDNLYIRVGSKVSEVVDGVATVSSLNALTTYDVAVLYYSPDGSAIEFTTTYPFPTKAKEYKLKTFEFTDLGEQITFTLSYTDRGNATNLAEATVLINGVEYQLTDGVVTVNKADVGQRVKTLVLKFKNQTVDGYEDIILYNPHALYMNDLIESQDNYNNMLDDIFK